MASIALGGVGAIVGSFFGQWQLGWSIGTVVGGLIDSLLSTGGKPPLRNLSVQLSAYGAPIPRVWGSMRIAGNVVWALPLQVSKHSPKNAPPTYTYYANCAVLLCPGPITGINRIWANDLLIYDSTATPSTKATIRIYTGTSTQTPDSLIEANLGVGQTPAYRDMAYCVFEHFDLTPYGGALPSFSFEVQVGTPPSIGQIVSDVCVECGLTTGQLDVSAATSTFIDGFCVPQRVQANQSLQDLLSVFGFDLAEVDTKLMLVARGQSSVVSITESDLGAYTSNKTETRLDARRAQDAEIPVEMDLTYLSSALNYQQMVQHAIRQTKPSTANAATVSLYGVLPDDVARQAAERLLYTAWREREQYRIVVGPKYAWLAPADIITLPGQGSYDKRLRIDNIDTALPGEIALTGVLDEVQVLSQSVTSPTVSVPSQEEITSAIPTTFLAFSGVELVNTDGFDTGFYVVAGPTSNAAPWTGATIYYSSDGGSSWFAAGQVSQAGAIGVTTSTLASYGGANPDTSHTVAVALTTGSLASASAAEVAAGANQALVGNEVLGYTTATLTSADHFTLSTLTRAELATSTAGHATGESFCTLGTQVRVTVPDSLAGSTIQVKVVGPDDTISGVTAQNVTLGTKSGGPMGSGSFYAQSNGGSSVGPENTYNFIPGIEIDSIAVADNPANHRIDVTVNASKQSPLTTKGDLWTYGSGDTRLPVGTNGQVLTADSAQSTGVKWAAAPGSSGTAQTWPVTILSPTITTYTALSTDMVIFCYTETLALTLTLPDPTTCQGKVYLIFNAYQGTSQGLTINSAAGSVVGITNLNGGTTRKSAWYISDGTNWHSFDNSSGN